MEEIKCKMEKTKMKINNYTFTFDKQCYVAEYCCGGCEGSGVCFNITGLVESNDEYYMFKNGFIKIKYCKCNNEDNKYEIFPRITVYNDKYNNNDNNSESTCTSFSDDEINEMYPKKVKNEWQVIEQCLNLESKFMKSLLKNCKKVVNNTNYGKENLQNERYIFNELNVT